jgi:hypothetical protein
MDTTPVGRNPAPITAVLVHGAFVDGSGWQAVHDILVKQGNEVLVVQNSTATLAGDVAAARQAIAAAQYPVILVGHSYGGAVITEAGKIPGSRASSTSPPSCQIRASPFRRLSPGRRPKERRPPPFCLLGTVF